MMDIRFREEFAPLDLKKCRCAHRRRRAGDFAAYREVFEYCFVEPMLMMGRLGALRPVPLAPDPLEDTSFGQMMGIYELSNDRVRWAKEFFDLYHESDERQFIRSGVFATEYGKQLLEGSRRYCRFLPRDRPSQRACRRKVTNLLTMYGRMRAAGGLVPSSKAVDFRPDAPWHYYDFPTAVDYFGYVKKRDGSHRRMVAAYLGLEQLDTLVLDFASLTLADCDRSLPYLREHFQWFHDTVLEGRLALAADDRAPAERSMARQFRVTRDASPATLPDSLRTARER